VVVPTVPLPAVEKYPDFGSYEYVDSLAVPLLRAEPVAPDSATGTVTIAALVDWNGQVVETRVIKSIPALDAAAIECVTGWTFRPAVHRGRRVASWVTIPVRFVGTE
jgi:TonB family protein